VAALSKLHVDENSWENLGGDFLDRTGSEPLIFSAEITAVSESAGPFYPCYL
jgi:hypothetical protein